MHQRRFAGVTIHAILYILFAMLCVPTAIAHLFALGYALLHIGQPAGNNDPNGFAIFILALAGMPMSVLPLLIFAGIGIGLFRLSNRIRIFMLVINVFLGVFLVIFINDMFMKPWKFSPQPTLLYKTACFVLTGLFFTSLIYFNLPRVKEQFKR